VERIAIVKPEKAKRLEDYLVQAATSRQLRPGSGEGGRISEDDLVAFLDRISEQEVAAAPKISVPYLLDLTIFMQFQRRRDFDDEDDY
jgi:DNA-binding TFAR19-related protein (PDSD5 family)